MRWVSELPAGWLTNTKVGCFLGVVPWVCLSCHACEGRLLSSLLFFPPQRLTPSSARICLTQAVLDTLEEGGRVAGRLLPLEVAQVCIMAMAASAVHLRCVAVTTRLSVYMMWAVAGQLVVNTAHVRHIQRRIPSDCGRHTFCNGV